MFFTNKQKFEDKQVEEAHAKVKMIKDSITIIKAKNADENYFSLENNRNALDYFAGKDVPAIAIKIRDAIYAKNINPGGNPLVEYPAMDGKVFTVSKIKILNHRWIIADFSNGLRWGETLLKYFIEEDGTITFKAVDSVLYPFEPY